MSKKPLSSAIYNRMHQAFGNVLRILLNMTPQRNMANAKHIIDDALATAMHAMQTTVTTTLGSCPGSLDFLSDMFLNVPLLADLQAIVHH